MDLKVTDDQLVINTHGDPDEVIRVKRLPGRSYDAEAQVWIVPCTPGLAQIFREAFPDYPSIVAILEEREAGFWKSLEERPKVYPRDLYTITAAEAINRAVNWVLWYKYHGDLQAYHRVYGGRNKTR